MKRALAVGFLALAAACGSSSSGPDPAIHPSALYSGFDGAGTFKVPATAANVDSKTVVKWSVADSSIADVATEDPANGAPSAPYTHHVTVTTKKAGQTTLRANVGGKTLEVPLTVTQYAPGARDLGNDLYQIDRPGNTDGPGQTYVKGLGCIGCHGVQGGPGHSPSEIGGYPDAAILKTIATGVKPDGKLANNGAHTFQLDATQQEAILARLRSLEPIDWPK